MNLNTAGISVEEAKKSAVYQWDVSIKPGNGSMKKLEAREYGNTYLLSPVIVKDPKAAKSWFQKNIGERWDYSAPNNYCSHYCVRGLNVGGAGVMTTTFLPTSFSIMPTMKWKFGFDYSPIAINR